MAEDSAPNIFLSHTEADQPIADALSNSIDRLFRGRVSVSYSTQRGGERSIRAGEDWFRWIGDQVRTSRVTIVLLTPRSISKPWLLWESGAVYGAALIGKHEVMLPVRPLLYNLDSADIPTPLQAANLQTLRGDSSTDVKQFLTELLTDIDVLTSAQKVQAGSLLDQIIRDYLRDVESGLHEEFAPLEESDIREWPTLKKVLALTITSLQALSPAAKINARYFHAIEADGRDVLVRANDLYIESIWMEEFGLGRVDVELDHDTVVVCQSFKARTPIYKVLTSDMAEQYRPELRSHIDPEQGWVLACPVLVTDAKPAGVLCLYGKKSPARTAADVDRLKQVITVLSEIFCQTFQADARLERRRSN
jgi:hypothetical protein